MVPRLLAAPLVAHAADRLRHHTLILCGCALFAALASISFLLARSLARALPVLHSAMLAPILDALAATAAKASRSGVGRRFDYGGLRAAVSAAYAPGALVSGWQAGAAELALLLPNLPLARSPAARPIRRRMPRCIAPPTMRMNKRAAPLFAPRPLPRSVPWCGGRR